MAVEAGLCATAWHKQCGAGATVAVRFRSKPVGPGGCFSMWILVAWPYPQALRHEPFQLRKLGEPATEEVSVGCVKRTTGGGK